MLMKAAACSCLWHQRGMQLAVGGVSVLIRASHYHCSVQPRVGMSLWSCRDPLMLSPSSPAGAVLCRAGLCRTFGILDLLGAVAGAPVLGLPKGGAGFYPIKAQRSSKMAVWESYLPTDQQRRCPQKLPGAGSSQASLYLCVSPFLPSPPSGLPASPDFQLHHRIWQVCGQSLVPSDRHET